MRRELFRRSCVALCAASLVWLPISAESQTRSGQGGGLNLSGNPNAPNGLNIAGVGVAQGPVAQGIANGVANPNSVTFGDYTAGGALLNVAGSTTSGLQELINNGQQTGFPVLWHGTTQATNYLFAYKGAWVTATPYTPNMVVQDGSTGNFYQTVNGPLGNYTSGASLAADVTAGHLVALNYAALGIPIPTSWGLSNGVPIYYPNFPINASSTVTIGPQQSGFNDLRNELINYTPATGAAAAVDSTYHTIALWGQISAPSTTGAALLVKSTRAWGTIDGMANEGFGVNLDYISVENIGANVGIGVQIDGSGVSAIQSSDFDLGETAALDPLIVTGGAHGVIGGTIHWRRLYASGGAGHNGLLVDTGVSGVTFSGIIADSVSGAGNTAVDLKGSNNILIIGIDGDEGIPAIGVKCETGAANNIIIVSRNDATTKYSGCAGTSNLIIDRGTVLLNGGFQPSEQLISTQTASASSVLNWTGLGSYPFHSYRLECRDIYQSAGTGAILGLQFGEGAGWTPKTTAYYEAGVSTAAGASTILNNPNQAYISLSAPGGLWSDATQPEFVSARISNVNNAGQVPIAKVQAISQNHAASTYTANLDSSGQYAGDTGAITAIGVVITASTMATGSCSLYGEAQ